MRFRRAGPGSKSVSAFHLQRSHGRTNWWSIRCDGVGLWSPCEPPKGEYRSGLREEEKRMSKAIENLEAAFQRATRIRPKVGGFPYLAETLRRWALRATSGRCPDVRACI